MMCNETSAHGNSIILVDDMGYARREVILKAAISELNSLGRTRSQRFTSVIGLSLEELPHFPITIDEVPPTAALIVLNEPKLVSLTNGQLPRIISPTIQAIYEILDYPLPNIPIFLVTPPRTLAGVDVLSLLISGVNGVIGAEVLGASETIRLLLDVSQHSTISRKLIVGEPSIRFSELHGFVRANEIRSAEWDLLFAIAQIPLLRLSLEKGKTPTNRHIARQVEQWHTITGYLPNSQAERYVGTLKAIVERELSLSNVGWEYDVPSIGAILLERGEISFSDVYEPHYLPLYARLLGLPLCPIPSRGIRFESLSTALYRYLTTIRIRSGRVQDRGDVVFSHITMPKE